MKRRNIWFSVAGLVYGALISLLTLLLIRNMGSVFEVLAGLFGVDAKTASHIAQALGQLRSGHLQIPWIMPMLLCALGGWLLSLIPGKVCRIWITAGVAVLLLLPLIFGILWLSHINGIMAGRLILSLLQWL